MLADDWDTCVAMARDAVKGGAHVLDVCVDYTGEDGVADMTEVASRFATQATLPIMLDSTEPPVIEAGLQLHRRQAHPQLGQPGGRRRARAPGSTGSCRLAREYGAAVVCTCIDTEGQARTAEWKLRAARAIHDLAVDRYGLAPEDLLFDPLVLPHQHRHGGEPAGRHRDHRRHPADQGRPARACGTIVGLSNVSFGLAPAARHALNSVFLHECQEAGLDAAIVHAARIMPLHKIDPRAVEVCLDLIYDRRDPATRLRPAAGAAAPVRRGRRRPSWSRRTAAAGRSSAGWSSASSTATATASKPTWTRRSPAAGPPSTSSTARCSAA